MVQQTLYLSDGYSSSKIGADLKRARLPKIRFHDLRHTFASLLIAQGEHPKYIQTQMGHSSISITMDIYGHLMESVNKESATKLGNTIFGTNDDIHNWENGSKTVAMGNKGEGSNRSSY